MRRLGDLTGAWLADVARGRRRTAVRAAAVLATLTAVAGLSLPGAGAEVSQSSAPADPAPVSHTRCASSGISTTCTGTYGGDTAWEPTAISHGNVHGQRIVGSKGAPNPAQPQVTVSQTTNVFNQEVQVSWTNFTPSTYGATLPSELATSPSDYDYNVQIVECRGTDPQVFATDCYTVNPGQAGEGGGSGAPNEVKTYTLPNGTNNVTFYVEAGSEINSFLGCDVDNPCSIAVVPNWGGVEPTKAGRVSTKENCSDHLQDFADVDGDLAGMAGDGANGSPDYIGAPCSWADRIVVPLSFGPTPANCPAATPQFYAAGSPMLERAMNQWIPAWCAGSSPLSLNYTFRTTEQQARTDFLQSTAAATAPTDVAMTTLPPDAAATAGSTRKFTYAPLAVSAVAISYYIDDPATKTPVTHLVLDARLIAKLLTESYSLNYNCSAEPPAPWPSLPAPSQTCDPSVVGNAATLFDDPEFLALNTHCAPLLQPANYTCTRADFPADSLSVSSGGQFLPTVPAGNSDMTEELTRWMSSNADAAAFVDGKVDPYDMHVNQNYFSQTYPLSQFVTLDDGATWPGQLSCTGGCQTGQWYETMQAAWNPVSGLDNVATDLASYQPTAQSPYLTCTIPAGCTNTNELTLSKFGQQSIGVRDLFSMVDEGDAGEFQFPTASLLNGAGQAVAPTVASMQAAVRDMGTNPDGITQFANTASADPAAYPVTLVDYAMVPTCGLGSAKASAIARFLANVATAGQVPGVTPGSLAPGYAPLDAVQRAQTLAAARAVQTQDCVSAPLDTTVSGLAGANNTGHTPSTSAAGKSKAAATPSATAIGRAHTLAYGSKSPLSGASGLLVLLALIAGALLLVGGPSVWALIATGKWPVVAGWLRSTASRVRTLPRLTRRA
jgi:hypothetical protein